MGAQIILCDPHRATVIGLDRKIPLKGIQMTSPDIRAGVSLLIAALSAEGESIIDNIDQIDRVTVILTKDSGILVQILKEFKKFSSNFSSSEGPSKINISITNEGILSISA